VSARVCAVCLIQKRARIGIACSTQHMGFAEYSSADTESVSPIPTPALPVSDLQVLEGICDENKTNVCCSKQEECILSSLMGN
jgi:hypothetical protein